MGAPDAGTSTGAEGVAYLVSGATSGSLDLGSAWAVLTGVAASDQAGVAVPGAGDVNGDRDPDLVVGAPGDDSAAKEGGATYVLLGPVLGSRALDSSELLVYGHDDDAASGSAVAGAGDVDGDGRDDLAIGAPADGSSQAGRVYLWTGD